MNIEKIKQFYHTPHSIMSFSKVFFCFCQRNKRGIIFCQREHHRFSTTPITTISWVNIINGLCTTKKVHLIYLVWHSMGVLSSLFSLTPLFTPQKKLKHKVLQNLYIFKYNLIQWWVDEMDLIRGTVEIEKWKGTEICVMNIIRRWFLVFCFRFF